MQKDKLTDEEIVKALGYCTKSRCDDETTGNCPLKNDESCGTILAINALDLICRLQYGYSSASKASDEWREKYEKERKENAELQELNAKYYNEAKDLRRENAELQNQVDELTVEKAELEAKANDTIEFWMYEYDNAVKDTAKEILTELIEKAHSNACIDLTVNEVKAWFREDYGVEVE